MSLEESTIDILNLSKRSYNALRRAGVSYISDFINLSEERLFSIKNLGVKSVQEILDKQLSFSKDLSNDPLQRQITSTPPALTDPNSILKRSNLAYDVITKVISISSSESSIDATLTLDNDSQVFYN